MREYLKEYYVTLEAVGPVFVGNGKQLSKKEYLFLGDKSVGVIDVNRFYTYVSKKARKRQLEDYFLRYESQNESLDQWLRENNFKKKEITPFLRYELDCQDTEIQRGKLQIMECYKDPYGDPMIPGSSLKGMLRTILLTGRIVRDPERYQHAKEHIGRKLKEEGPKVPKKQFLKSERDELEQRAFNTLKRPRTRLGDAVNDELSGIIVGDSKPLSMRNVILCQKLEGHIDGSTKRLNLLRECIRPGTEIEFTVTIDETVCSVTVKELMESIQIFNQLYVECFLSRFPNVDYPTPNTVYLGGGVGFVSKTFIYPMFGGEKGIFATQKIFKETGVSKKHRHFKDHILKVSPHIIKYAQYRGRNLQYGQCLLKIAQLQ